jgi:chemotaxis protein methyltransferase CheR
MDLILCRNVLIYFSQDTTQRVVGRLYDALADGGWLVVGHAEPSQTTFRSFVTHNFPGTVIYQKREADIAIPRQVGGSSVLSRQAENSGAPDLSGPLAANGRAPLTSPIGIAQTAQHGMAAPSRPDRTREVATPARPAEPGRATKPAASTSAIETALTLERNGQHHEALPRSARLRQSEEISRLSPRDSQAPYLAAKLLANRLQLDAAEAQIKIALERAPLMAPAHHLHGMILAEQGRLTEALAALRRCVYADPQFVLGQFALAELLAKMGQTARAEKGREITLRLLDSYRPDDPIPEGDGLTAGRLSEILRNHRV